MSGFFPLLHFRRLSLSASFALLMVLLFPTQLAAQGDQGHKHHHYKLIDLGTFGGPLSGINAEPTGHFINHPGAVVGWADTAVATPVPDCYNPVLNPDCFIAHAFVWQGNSLQDLGTLPGGNFSFAYAINARGQIAGVSENDQIDPVGNGYPEFRAVLWEKGKLQDLGTLGGTSSFASSINDPGQIVGPALNDVPDPFSMLGIGSFTSMTQTRAFLWDHGTMQDLGTLGGPDSWALLINNRGQVAGFSYTSDVPDPNSGVPPIHPFLWTKGKGMQDLGNLGGTNPLFNDRFSYLVSGLNERGQVTGTMTLPGDQIYHAYLWDGKKLVDLGNSLGGDGANAYGLNDAGVVIGLACLPGECIYHAFRWENGVMTDLGPGVDGDPCSAAFNINSKGQIVGVSQDSCDPFTRAVLWEKGEPAVDLNTLIPPGSPLQLKVAYFISERGEIVGTGGPPGCAVDDDSCPHAYVLIPCDDDHPAIEGCDYSLVEAAATSQSHVAQAEQPTAQASVARLSPIQRAAQFHAAISSRDRAVRALLKTLAQK